MDNQSKKDRAKRVILELVRAAPGEVFYNKTNLYKAFWKAHLAYSATNADYLSAWPIVKMPNGPGIDKGDVLIGEMLEDGWLSLREERTGQFTAMVFGIGQTAPPCALSREAVDAIRKAVSEVDGKSAKEVSDESHRTSRAWNAAEIGKELNAYLDIAEPSEVAELDELIAVLKSE